MTTSRNKLLLKALLAIDTAELMLPQASDHEVEDQAVSLMHLPMRELSLTYERLVDNLDLSDEEDMEVE